MRRASTLVLAAAVMGLGAWAPGAELRLGPPLLCVEVEPGCEVTLPETMTTRYDADKLPGDVRAALKKTTTVCGRMEVWRRGAQLAIGTGKVDELALRMCAEAVAAALDAEARRAHPRERADAWFDAGYSLAVFEQFGRSPLKGYGVAEGFTGYGYLRMALGIARDVFASTEQEPQGKGESTADRVASMELAAAMVTMPRCGTSLPKKRNATGRSISIT